MPRSDGADRLRGRLGPDLAALVADVGVPLAAASRITGLPSRLLTRATFRLDFGDGRRLKGRRLDTPDDAERVATLAACVDAPAVTRVVSRRGAALLEEWVSGVALHRRRLGEDDLRRSGALLGAIHAAAGPAGPWTAAPPSPEQRLASADADLVELARLELLVPAVVDRLREALRRHAPVRQAVGVIHRDFAPENIVVDADGTLHVVDNETLTVDAYDFDLARTWYRWPMTPAARQAFEAGYATVRGLDGYRAHFPFWAVAVLSEAALFRHRAQTRGQHVPLRRVGEVLALLDRGHGP